MPIDIFISYRRSDAAGHARLLHKDLAQYFDTERLFFDRETIDSGADFPSTLSNAVAEAKVLLVVIAPQWLKVTDEQGKRRLEDSDDFVRKEIGLGLHQGKKVIPVLLDDAPMPGASDLPEELKLLAARDALTLRGKNYEYDRQLTELLRLIAATPGVAQPRRLPNGVDERPFRSSEQVLSPHFCGRDAELAEIARAFQGDAAGRPKAVAVWGSGGAGKTQVALRYALEHASHYAGVWWFRAQSLALLDQDFAALISACAVPNTDERESSREAVRRWLSRQPPWLVVFDNAEEVSSIRDSLPDQGPHHALITSRNPSWSGLATPVEVRPWDEARALEFLRLRLPSETQSLRSSLAESLRGLPLALEQAAAYCEEVGIDLGEYLRRLEKTGAAKLLAKGKAATGYPDSIARTVSVAFERLPPAAAQLMQHLAWFAEEPVPDDLFLGRPDLLPEPLRGAAADELDFDDLVSALRKFGLAERIPASGDRASGGALRLHRLTRAVVREMHSVDGIVVPVVVALIDAACPDGEDPGLWPRWAALLPHLIDPVPGEAATRTAPETWARVRTALRHYQAAGRSASIQYLMGSLKRLGQQLSGESVDPPSSDLDVSLASAFALAEEALAASRRLLGDEHPDTLVAKGTLARMLREKGAIEEQMLAARRRSLGDERVDPPTNVNIFDVILPGDYALAEEALAASRRLLGDEHPDTLVAMGTLVRMLRAKGDLGGVRALEEQMLAAHRRMLGDEHPDTLRSMVELADTLRSQDDFAGARVLYEQVLGIRGRGTLRSAQDNLSREEMLSLSYSARRSLPKRRA